MLAKKIALGFGIAIILPMMMHYGVSTFFPEPRWDDYHKTVYEDKHRTKQEEEKAEKEQQKKEDEYNSNKMAFGRHLFYVEVPVGIAAVIIGAFLAIQSIGAGLVFGGIFCATDGYWEYWSDLPDWMKFVSLLACFIVLLVVGYKKIGNKT